MKETRKKKGKMDTHGRKLNQNSVSLKQSVLVTRFETEIKRSSSVLLKSGSNLCRGGPIPEMPIDANAPLQRDGGAVRGLGKYLLLEKPEIISSLKTEWDSVVQFLSSPPFHSPCTLFTKAENVTMGTHYQATSVAWHDAQWLLGHGCQWLLGSVGQYVCVCVHVLHTCEEEEKVCV